MSVNLSDFTRGLLPLPVIIFARDDQLFESIYTYHMVARQLKILFVCTVNRMRSATAQKIFGSDPRFKVDSAGTDRTADTVLEQEQLEWADIVIVMEKYHDNFIRDKFPEWYNINKIICLHIRDNYDFMQPELVTILKNKMEDVFKRGLPGQLAVGLLDRPFRQVLA